MRNDRQSIKNRKSKKIDGKKCSLKWLKIELERGIDPTRRSPKKESGSETSFLINLKKVVKKKCPQILM